MPRQDRLDTLRALVKSGKYRTQSELVDALADQGVTVTQSSISRDMSAIGLTKTDGVYTLPAHTGNIEIPDLSAPALRHLLSVTAAGDNLLVLRLPPARAQLAASAIDKLEIEGVAGTIAGDDTVFLAIADKRLTKPLARQLRITAGLSD